MSYLVLARKWRPQCFEDVIGQTHVTKTLQNALRQNRIAHALLFSGPRGVGKTSVARILSKALNCDRGPSPVPCNECPTCIRITEGNEVDVLEIDGASNRGIDEIRQLREDIKFKPTHCKYKINIIDEVHMLTKEAFNALLKTLEEPPPHVYFIFATTEPQRIPATIHSRCQHFEFRRLSMSELKSHLQRISDAEGLGLEEDAITLLARQAKGSVRDSLSLLDQIAAFGAKTSSEVCQALGVVETVAVQRLAYSILNRNPSDALKLIDELYRFGHDLHGLTQQLIQFFRHLLVIKTVNHNNIEELVELSPEEIRNAVDMTGPYSKLDILQLLDTMLSESDAVRRSNSPKIRLELLILRLCQLEETIDLPDILGKIEGLLSKISTTPPTSPENHPTPKEIKREEPPKPATSYSSQQTPRDIPRHEPSEKTGTENPSKESVQDITGHADNNDPPDDKSYQERWEMFLVYMDKRSPVVSSSLRQCNFLGIENDTIKLACPSDLIKTLITDPDRKDAIYSVIKQIFNKNLKFHIESSAKNSSKEESKRHKDRQNQLISTPVVQEALKIFDGRIGKIRLYN